MAVTTTKRVAYKAQIKVTFLCDKESIDIPQSKITYMYLDHQYEKNVMPMPYMGLLVNDDLYAKIVDNKAKGLFKIEIKKIQLEAKTTAGLVMLRDTFSYIVSTSTTNMMKDLVEASSNEGKDKYRKLMIGLVSKTMTNKLRKSFNGVYNNVKESTLVSLALEGTNPVIETLTTNKSYSSIIIPPLSTRFQLLNFIFEKDPYYNTNFIMYMDYEKTYLLSKNGKKVDAKDGKPTSVIINVSQVTNKEAFYEGMSIADDHYYVDMNPVDVQIISNQGSDKMVDNITVLDENNKKYDLDIDYPDETEGLDKKKVFVRSNNPELLKNQIELNQSRVQITKNYVDTSVFTPNKAYSIVNFKGNENFNGCYMLESKREIFKPTVDCFEMSAVLVLKKVGKMNKISANVAGGQSYNKNGNKAVTPTSRRSTTASMQSSANVRKEP